MLYVQQSLGDDEELIHIGRFHWMYTFQAVMSIVWGVIWGIAVISASIVFKQEIGSGFYAVNLFGMIGELHPGLKILAFFMVILGLLRFAQMMIFKVTTEVVVTTLRIIYKRGLVARYVGEMSIDRIEGVNVLQSVLGRIFGYGRVAVRGMGVGEVLLPPLANPVTFRRAIDKARIKNRQSATSSV